MARSQGLTATNRSQKAQETSIDPQAVARVAYGLYEQRGREDGHALGDWLNAEAIVREQNQRRGRILV
jgi:hypothetical protein